MTMVGRDEVLHVRRMRFVKAYHLHLIAMGQKQHLMVKQWNNPSKLVHGKCVEASAPDQSRTQAVKTHHVIPSKCSLAV